MRRNNEKDSGLSLGADEAAILSEELVALPEDLRLALVLRYQEGFRLAAVGELLGCAESTVHNRIRRGLERLKMRLKGRGVGLAGLSLPDLVLAHKDIPVPGGLKGRLLGLAGGKALAASLLLKPLVLLPLGLVLVGLGSLALLRGEGGAKKPASEKAGILVLKEQEGSGGGSETKGAAGGQLQGGRERVQGPKGGIGKPQSGGKAPLATVQGLVQDKNGRPLQGAEIVATTYAFQGKFPLHQVSAKSLVDGSFVLRLPIDAKGGLRYGFWARREGYRDARQGPLLLKAGKEQRLSRFLLTPRIEEKVGRYRLRVRVVDPVGRGLAKVRLRLVRELPGKPRAIQKNESVGATDEKGEAVLSGRFLGDKVLVVDGRYTEEGGRRIVRRLAIQSPGTHLERVVMKPGLKIQGRVLGGRGEPVQGLQLRAYQPGESQDSMSDWTDKQGNFSIRGLNEGAYTLDFVQEGLAYSPFTLPGVQAGTKGLTIQLKSKYSSKDVGLHDAEIHGSFVDSKTGESVSLGVLDWSLHRIPWDIGNKQSWLRSLQADLVQPSPVQVALMGELAKPSGRFHVTGLTPGWYAVSARKQDKAIALSGPIHLQGRQIVAGVVLRLEDGGRLAGQVLTPEGKPLAGALIRVGGEGGDARSRNRSFDAKVAEPGDRRAAAWLGGSGVGKPVTDAKGRFILQHLPTGLPLRVNAFHRNYRPVHRSGILLRAGLPAKDLVLRFTNKR